MDVQVPDTSPQLARARRASQRVRQQVADEFGALTEGEVADLLGELPGRTALRSLDGTYPAFQFSVGRNVLPVIGPLLELARANTWPDQDVIYWLMGPSAAFVDERRPVDHLNDAAAVLGAAKLAFEATW